MWCNGSTAAFKPACLGSSPSTPAKNKKGDYVNTIFFILGLIFFIIALNKVQGRDRLTHRFTIKDEIIFAVFYIGGAFLLGAAIAITFVD